MYENNGREINGGISYFLEIWICFLLLKLRKILIGKKENE